MTGIIEWTHDAECALRPELAMALGAPRWLDDDLHGIVFETDKECDFFAAISGARNRFGKPPLIPPRGVPARLSGPASRYFRDYGTELGGWLHLSEIEKCIQHISDGSFRTGFEVDVALDLMRLIVGKLSDPHVRLVFSIESP
jgi:hypothetical protein